VDSRAVLETVLDIGVVNGAMLPALGMGVRKSGRTTALTTGEIQVLDATVTINYSLMRTATFENQIVAGPMSSGGDSGSLVVANDTASAVGLLFAGSDEATIFNPIQAVMDQLRIDIGKTKEDKSLNRQASIEKAQAVRLKYQDWLMSKANVVGVGVGLRHTGGKRTDSVALVVMVRRKVPAAALDPQDLLPLEIEGVPVDVKEVGEVAAITQ
jgi:hypothetical protein